MSIDLATIGVVFDASGLERGQKAFSDTERAANSAAQAATQAGQSFASSSEKVATAARSTNASFDKLTLGQTQFIEKLREQATTAGMSRTQLLAYQAAELGVTEQTKAMIKQIEEATKAQGAHGAGMGSSLVKMESLRVAHDIMIGAYTRMASALFVIAGATNAFSLLLNPLALGIVAVTGTLAAFAVAASQGHDQMVKMNNALAMTSNYAGMTRSDMANLANSMTQTKEVTIGAANEIVLALVASGRVGGESINKIGKFISDFAKASGEDIDKVTPKMIALFQDPQKGAEELNKSMHFLTATQLEHIAALERTGQVQQAQLALADALAAKVPKQVENISNMTRLINEQKDAWTKLWAAMQKPNDSQLKGEALAQSLRDQISEYLASGLTRKDPAVERVQKQLDALTPAIKAQKELTAAEKEAAAANELQSKSWDAVKASSSAYHVQELRDRLKLAESFKPEAGPDFAAQKTAQADAIRKINEEIESATRSMTAADRQMYTQRLAAEESLRQVKLKSTEDDLSTMLKIGAMGKEEFDRRMLNNSLEQNQSKQTYEEAMIHVAGLTAAERQAHQQKLALLKAEQDAIESKGVNSQRVDAFNVTSASTDMMNKYISSLTAEAQKLEEANANREKTRDTIELENIARLDTAIALQKQFMAEQEKNGATQSELENSPRVLKFLEDERDARERIAKALNQEDVDKANKTAAQNAQREWKRSSEKIADDLANAIIDGGGNGLKKMLHDIEMGFARLILRPVIQPIADGFASIFNPGAASASGVTGGTSGASGLIGAANTAATAYKAISGGFAGIGSSIGGVVSGFGNMVGSSSISAFGSGMGMSAAQASEAAALYNGAGMAGTGSALTAGSMAGSAAGIGAGIFGGIKVGGAISGDYGSRSTVNAGTAIGTGIGAVVAGPIGAAIGAFLGGTVGGLLNRAFGMGDKKVTSQGISGTISESGTTGTGYSNWHQDGGWFRSDKNGTDKSALDPSVVNSFSAGLSQLKTASTSFASNIGVTSNALAGYSKSFDIAMTSDAATNQKNITDFFTTMADDMASKLVPNLAQFTRSGETASTTLQRLSDEFKATDGIAQALGKTATDMFKGAGIETTKARERVLDALGGTSSASTIMANYAQNYLTEAQKLEPALKAVNAAMASLGYQGVDTREKFAGLVNGLVDSGAILTDAGAKQFADLMSLSDAFAATHAAISQAADGVKSLADAANERQQLQDQLDQLTMTSTQLLMKQRNALDASNRALFDQVTQAQKLKDAQDASKKSLTDLISGLGSFRDSAKSAHDGLATSSLSTLTPEQQYEELRRQYEATKSAAMGGDASAQSSYASVMNAFLTMSQKLNAGDARYAADYNMAEQDSANAEEWAKTGIEVAQSQLDALNNQVVYLADLAVTAHQIASAVPEASANSDANMASVVVELRALRDSNADLVAQLAALRDEQNRQTADMIVQNAKAQENTAEAVVQGVSDAVSQNGKAVWVSNDGWLDQ
jgi:phage-related minor tail protein